MFKRLKPCPFCGKDAEVESTGDGRYYIACSHGCIEQMKFYGSFRTAAFAWNKRVAEPGRITCSECKNADYERGSYYCTLHQHHVKQDDFCSDGKERER